jgi:hypothetical protein
MRFGLLPRIASMARALRRAAYFSVARPFSSQQIDLATTFADQAVIAIENVRLFDEVQTRTRELSQSVGELRALGEVSQAINSTLEWKRPLRAAGSCPRSRGTVVRFGL